MNLHVQVPYCPVSLQHNGAWKKNYQWGQMSASVTKKTENQKVNFDRHTSKETWFTGKEINLLGDPQLHVSHRQLSPVKMPEEGKNKTKHQSCTWVISVIPSNCCRRQRAWEHGQWCLREPSPSGYLLEAGMCNAVPDLEVVRRLPRAQEGRVECLLILAVASFWMGQARLVNKLEGKRFLGDQTKLSLQIPTRNWPTANRTATVKYITWTNSSGG